MKKVALITGAAGGIGYATAEKFAKEGYAIVAMDIVPADKVADKFASFEDAIYISGNLARSEDRINANKH